MRTRARLLTDPREHAQLSAQAGCLHDCNESGRREEPPRDESGFRALGSIQRFHRLLRHAVARARTTAPSLAGVSPAAEEFSFLMGDGASRPGRCRVKAFRPGCLNQDTSGMGQNFIESGREQGFLLPPNVRDWLPADHLAWFVIDAVADLDLALFYGRIGRMVTVARRMSRR